MFNTSLTDNFLTKMQERSNEWKSKPALNYSIVIPPELKWVIYQEYGIDHSYEISGPNGIAFTGDHGVIIRPSITHPENYVIHPGLEPTHTIGTVNESIMDGLIQAAIREAFAESDFDPVAVNAYMVKYMEVIKQEIKEQMATDLPGTRPPDPSFPNQSGKLRGRTAAEVFDEYAQVIEKE